MKYFYKIKKICVLLCMAILLTGAIGIMHPLEVQAAAKKVTSVELNYNTYALKPRQTIKLSAACLPKTAKNRSVKWKSSNKAVATVSSAGKVTAKKTGTAKITATAKDGSGKKAVCTIKVVKKLTRIKEIKLSASKKSIEPGTKLTIKAGIKPAKSTLKTLKWESSNEKTATVSQKGVVKALQEGTVKITAKAQDGSKKKAVYTLKIEKKKTEAPGTTEEPSDNIADPQPQPEPVEENIPVTQIELEESDIRIRAGKTMQLMASVVPTNATEKGILWSSSNSEAVSVDENGMITAITEGETAVITATSKQSVQISASCSVTVLPAKELASNHAGNSYVYELDRNAQQYQQIYTEEGKESISVMEASEVSRSVFRMGMAVRNGITTRQAFYNMIKTVCEENTFALFGMENLTIKEYAEDYSSITLQKEEESGTRTVVIENIDILEAGEEVTDPNGLTTKASRVQFCIGEEELILEVYYNGSRIALYRPNYSGAHFEFYIDNTNYRYVIRMTKLFNGILMDEMNTFPNLKYLDIYNIY